jgi:hypothetical protein
MSLALLALAACAPQGGVPEVAREGECITLFRQYDDLQQWVRRRDDVTIPPELELQQIWLRQAGCITMNDALAGMESLPLVPVTDSGPAIAPISLHAGVVTSDATDAQVRAFFEARGVRARSIGEAGMGRRIYLGPFATQGALEGARDLALAAGFVGPYTARF